MTTKTLLERLREVLAKRTPSPWCPGHSHGAPQIESGKTPRGGKNLVTPFVENAHDCEAICAAVNVSDALIAVALVAARPGITDSGFYGEVDPDDVADLRDALAALDAAIVEAIG